VSSERKDGEGNRNVQANFNTVRTGRANPAMLDRIEVSWLALVLFFLIYDEVLSVA
jgi:ribosome recycling factor